MPESEAILVSITSIFVLGIGSQWVASRLKIPSILLLLGTGIAAGPVFHVLNPDQLLGDLLLPVVSLCVSVVLFEGGLSLRLADLKQIGRPLAMLLTVGVAVTWVLCTVAAFFLLHFPLSQSLLLGAVLTVTGPTVVGPMLQHIRPTGRVGPIARWEGIVVDPIGAVLAVLVFSTLGAVEAAQFSSAAWLAVKGFLQTFLIGLVVGLVAAGICFELLRRHWIADHLQSPFALMMVVLSFTVSNLFAHESGLVTVTLMGVILANQDRVSIRHIVEFKENLTVLLISGLFILLSARLDLAQFGKAGWRGPAFVAYVILIARPVSVWIATIGSGLNRKERIFLSWLAPRGIVAAAVASVFALELGGGEEFVAVTFMVIIGTVVTYSLTTGQLARRIGLAVPNPQGILFASAHPGARAIAMALQNAGISVRLIDRNADNIKAARMEGLPTFYADVLSDAVHEELDLGGIGRFIAMTPNDEVNSLAASHFADVFGRTEVYRLSSPSEGTRRKEKSSEVLHGRVVFADDATYRYLDQRFEQGAIIKKNKLTEEYTIEDLKEQYGNSALPLFIIGESGKVSICTPELSPSFRSGQTILSLVDRPAEEPKPTT